MFSCIPRLWIFQIKSFCKIFFLSLSGFISILLLTRLKEMARFLSLSSSYLLTLKFSLLQIPLILPLAIPISCLIASFMIFYRKQEILALRAGGLSLSKILFSILTISFLIFLSNFYLVSEVAPLCREKSKTMLQNKTSVNPILLLQRKNLSRLKRAFIDLKPKTNEEASNLVCLFPIHSQHHLLLFLAERLNVEEKTLVGSNVSFLSYFSPSEEKNFEPLVVENLSKLYMGTDVLGQSMKHVGISRPPSSYQLSKLTSLLLYSPHKNLGTLTLEIVRRFAIALSAFTFTLLGASFGIQIGRQISYKNIFLAAFIALLILSTFTLSKAFCHSYLFAISLYLLPQILLFFSCRRFLIRINRGIER